MKIPPLVIFDMDGLMLDTERIGWLAWQEALKPFHVEMNFSAYTAIIGTNQSFTRNFAQKAFGENFPVDGFLTAVWARRMSMVRELGVPKKPGLVELLAFLKEQNTVCAVATSSDRSSMEELLRAAGVWDFFSISVCGDEVTQGKPHPEIFLSAAGNAGVPPERAMVLEDSANGIRAAFAAGMTGVFIKDLIDLPSDAAAMAATKLDSLFDVIDWIKRA